MASLTTATRGDASGPLLVVIHGMGEDEQRSIRISERFDPDGRFYTVAPRAPNKVPGGYSWFPTWGERSTRATIGQIRKLVLAESEGRDLSETCLIGFSEGGAAALTLAYDTKALPVRAVISIAGFQPRSMTFAGVGQEADRVPPALLVHGSNDRTISAAETEHLGTVLEGLGASVTMLGFDGAHHIPTAVLQQAREWYAGLGMSRSV